MWDNGTFGENGEEEGNTEEASESGAEETQTDADESYQETEEGSHSEMEGGEFAIIDLERERRGLHGENNNVPKTEDIRTAQRGMLHFIYLSIIHLTFMSHAQAHMIYLVEE